MLQHLNSAAGLFLLFLIYSTLGWCGEMIYCSIGQRKLCEKRGFLNGFLCPIYGFGALLVLWALRGGCESPVLTFFFGALLTSAVEYFTSYLMEKLFHMRWWDYSRYKFQIHGRVCLLNSTLFGLLCVALCHLVHPEVMKLIRFLMARHIALPLAAALFVLFTADVVLSVRSAIQIGNRLEKLQALQDELQEKLEELANEQRRRAESRKAERQERLEELTRQYDAIELAVNTLERAGAELQSRFSPALGRRAAELFSRLTGGRYDELAVSRDFSVLVKRAGDTVARGSLYLSAGAADLMYLAVRLAIAELVLPGDEPCPIILDDALAYLDPARRERVLALLEEIGEKRQVILFTCS